jgi:PIN domain nuclease of toxin-antitoxin system
MIYLLDTHTFLCMLRVPSSLPRKVLVIVRDEAQRLVLSLATPWEMAIRTNLGKLKAMGVLNDFDRLIARGGFSMLETTPRQVIRSGLLPLHHRDPFNRLLAAQALELQIPVISCDERFEAYGVRRVWN